MKNKKLNLKEFKVKSFVTDLENYKSHTVKGGAVTDNCLPPEDIPLPESGQVTCGLSTYYCCTNAALK